MSTILAFSFVRYLIFTAQYVILLYVFSENFDLLNSVIFVPVSFIMNSIIPSITLAELGVREMVGLKLSEIYYNVAVVLSTLSLWIINILTPSIVGALIILTAKLFPDK
tara:strand:+ start:1433 stop:1759 length:327 start_codon:yes stop_codon:yes gene_type:complete